MGHYEHTGCKQSNPNSNVQLRSQRQPFANKANNTDQSGAEKENDALSKFCIMRKRLI